MSSSVKTIGIAASIFMLLMLIIFGSGFLLQAGRAQNLNRSQFSDNSPARTITVSGFGRTRAQPDYAIIHLVVHTEAENAQEAVSKNGEQVQSLLGVLSDKGIQSEAIHTQTVALQTRYSGLANRSLTARKFLGYTASSLVEVRMSEINTVWPLLDTLVQTPDILIENIRFEVGDPSQELDQARAEALDDARNKAERLAALMNATLDEIQAIDETSRMPFIISQEGFPVEDKSSMDPGAQFVEVLVETTWILSTDLQSLDPGEEQHQPIVTESPLDVDP